MFEVMLFLAIAIAVAATVIAYDGSRDVFHPLVLIGPMMAFLYGWMPLKLLHADGLSRFFDDGQLRLVQTLNLCGIFAFLGACLLVGVRVRRKDRQPEALTPRACGRLLVGSALVGSLGLGCWLTTIIEVGGFVNAFSASYSGGWDDNGYIRDGSLLLLLGVLFAITSMSSGGSRLIGTVLALTFGLPWLASALLMGRRGPTFALAVVVLMGWYFNRSRRPPLILVGAAGVCLGWLVLFLVTNRSQIYLGSSFDVKSDVSDIVEKPDTGNEYIYGSGTVLATMRRDHYFWMKRYLAQIMVRPIPSAVWPTKYEDFGVPELLHNAGTGEGIGDALGWVGAVGSAPGIVGDLFVEVWWFAIALMAVLGWAYGVIWKRAVERGGAWATQYVVISALSIYLVMQTMEAIIFRTVLLSVPCWLVWKFALASPSRRRARSAKFPRTARLDLSRSPALKSSSALPSPAPQSPERYREVSHV